MFAEVETLGRRLAACQVDVLADVDVRSLRTHDLAASAKVLMRHRAKLPASQACARNDVIRCLRDLPAIQEAYRRGLVESENEMLHKSAKMVHSRFCKYLTGWERLADEDGARKDDQTTHEKRKAGIVQNFDKAASMCRPTTRIGPISSAEPSMEPLPTPQRLQ
ncbi:MAG: hypothetical protein GY925_20630 [Actinomycetia bacterium]|nr:hypothetical protein [Actinomycetes bacterium]